MKGTVVFFNHRSLLQRKNCLIDIFLQTTGLFFKGIFIKIDGFFSTRRLYFIEIFINELSLYVYGALKISFNYSLSIVFFLLLNQSRYGTGTAQPGTSFNAALNQNNRLYQPVLWIRIWIGSVVSNFVDANPYSEYGSGSA